MHPYQTFVLVQLHQFEAEQAAKASRLQAAARRAAVSEQDVPAWRRRVGFRLVEAGLRLAIGKTAHPPSRLDAAGEWSALAR